MIIKFISDLITDGGLAPGITYERHRGKGTDHQAAARVDQMLLPVPADGTPDNEAMYVECLRKKGQAG